MKALAGLLALGALAIGLVLLLGRPAPAPSPQEGSAAPPAGRALEELRAELAALRAEVDALREAQAENAAGLARLEAQPAAPAPPERVAAGADEELREEVRELAAALGDPAGADPAGLEVFVLDVLAQRDERERAERREQRWNAITERIGERVHELAGELGLSSFQEQEMVTVLTGEAARRETFFEEMRTSGSWDREVIREGMRGLREETLSALGGVLTAEQLEGYRALEDGRFGPPGGRRREAGSSEYEYRVF